VKPTRPDFPTAAKQKLAEDRDVLSAAVEGLLSADASRISVRSVRMGDLHLRPDRVSTPATEPAVDALVASIRGVGMLEPILARPRAAGGFEVIAGVRRWRAATIVGLTSVPVVIRDIDDATAAELAAAGQSRVVATPIAVEPAPVVAEAAPVPMAAAAAAADVDGGTGVPVMSERVRVDPQVSAPRPMVVQPAAERPYGMPAPARSAAPNREPRVISGPGLSVDRHRPTPPDRQPVTPEFRTPRPVPIPPAARASMSRPAESPTDELPRRRLGFGLLPRLRPATRRDRF
jgi:hypothetical protein